MIWLHPPTPTPLSLRQIVTLSQSSCVLPVEFNDGRGGRGRRGAKSYTTARKPGPLKSFNSRRALYFFIDVHSLEALWHWQSGFLHLERLGVRILTCQDLRVTSVKFEGKNNASEEKCKKILNEVKW